MSNELKKAYWLLHISILLFGFTAILGKKISLDASVLVWHRLWITCLAIVFIPGVLKAIGSMTRKEIIRFMGIGIITSMHWLAFYGSIKLSNVSIALSCLATTALFTSFIEPFFFKRKINPIEVILGVAVAIGIAIITHATFGYEKGIMVGLLAAVLAAIFSTLNKKYMQNHNPVTMTFLELGTGFLFISVILPFYFSKFPQTVFQPTAEDWGWLLVLAILCTAVAYVMALMALKEISAFNSSLALNLEPVYGILMAMAFFDEQKELGFQFYLGTGIILLSVFLYPVMKRRQRKKQNKAALAA
ncbi:MAG: EamA family transporter [Bacteroidetes bacterium]|nr:EamA family transporter [Bacteroidota bacterium]